MRLNDDVQAAGSDEAALKMGVRAERSEELGSRGGLGWCRMEVQMSGFGEGMGSLTKL